MGDQSILRYRINSNPDSRNKYTATIQTPSKKRSRSSLIKGNPYINRYKEYSEYINKALPCIHTYNLISLKNQAISHFPEAEVRNCTAIKLSTIILDCIKDININPQNGMPGSEKFYHRCLESIERNDEQYPADDIESVIILLEQMYSILKGSGIICVSEKSIKKQLPCNSSGRRYLKLFDAFWNKIKWNELFLSMPDTAARLQKNRKSIPRILIKRQGAFRLDEAANEMIKIADAGRENDIFLISFIDFYLFTWLSHFGIVEYLPGHDHEPVMIRLSGHGRQFLSLL